MFNRSYTQGLAILSREHHAGPKCNDWQAMMIVDAPQHDQVEHRAVRWPRKNEYDFNMYLDSRWLYKIGQ